MAALAAAFLVSPVFGDPSEPVMAGDKPVMAGDLQVAASGHDDLRAVKAGDGVAVKIVADEDGGMQVVAIHEDGTTTPLTAMGYAVEVVLLLVSGDVALTAGRCPVLGVEPRHSEIGGVPIEFAVKAVCAGVGE